MPTASQDALVIPTDMTTLSDETLAETLTRATEEFDAAYGDGQSVSDATYETLATLSTGIKALGAEKAARDLAAKERNGRAAELAADVRSMSAIPEDGTEPLTDEDGYVVNEAGERVLDEAGDPILASDANADAALVNAAGTVTAGATTSPRVPQRRQRPRVASIADGKMKDVAYATTDIAGYANNQAIDWDDAGKMLDKRMQSFNKSAYEAAAARGQHMRETGNLMAFKRQIPAELVASGNDQQVEDAIKRATDIARLPNGSLTAAGWCAPSEVLYDLCSNESRDGLYSIPEFGVKRGGVRAPISPSFAEIYNATGFCFTEEQAENGEYAPGANPGDPNVVGDKPCYEVPCPTWEDHRLEGCGLCITGDIISMRGYPEGMARWMSGILIAHDHKMSARAISKVIAGSTPVTMTAGTVGATAPILAAVELQAEHMRYSERMSRSTTLEAVFPYWVHGAIRQDLSVRLGLALFDVTDAQIDSWFRLRNIAPQFVYDWQALDATPVASFKTWPTTVQFLLYPAGTWAKGVDDIITLDNLYDSTQLGQNKYTALFTEEAWLILKRCNDSRVVTVPIVPDGSTHAGVLLEGTLAPTPAP